MTERTVIAAAGAGRMGRGIAVAFAYAGHPVRLIDMKPGRGAGFADLSRDAAREVLETLHLLSEFGLLSGAEADQAAALVSVHPLDEAPAALQGARIIFEGVPETLAAKQAAFEFLSQHAAPGAILASTTSTILSTDLEGFVAGPERFLNAHWLNPAYLMPLVELSPGNATAPATTARLKQLLEAMGKVPVVCKPSPGYIVPRIQALAMNEAARLAEEGVASAEDIDRAITHGFGTRFAVLGMLEFIDWGGGDILYHASRYLTEATGQDRFTAPRIIEDNMAQKRRGLHDGAGFLNYENLDIAAYRKARIAAFTSLLRDMNRLPVKGG